LNVTGPCLGLSVPATNLQEEEVVFGGTERLREEIDGTLRIMEGKLYFVLTGCLPEVTGDDVPGLVAEYASRGIPLVAASAPGFKGDSYAGYGEVMKTIVAKVLKRKSPKNGSKSPGASGKDMINVWGVPPHFDPFWKGNLLGIKKLAGLLDLEANVFFGPEANLGTVRNAARARLNVLVSGIYGAEAAELFLEIHGVPFVSAPLPFGTAASERFLDIVGAALSIPKSLTRKAKAKARAERHAYLEPAVDLYNDMEIQRHALVVGDANYAFALSDFLADDLGWIPELVVVTNELSPEEKSRLENHRKKTGGTPPERLIFENRRAGIREAAKEIWGGRGEKYRDPLTPVFVAGSSLERSLARELGASCLSLSYPVSDRAILAKGFTGHFGGLELTEDLIGACAAVR
jgi:nitrogenase molybdenum-iron protein beta chain